MNQWQLIQQLQSLLQAATWPDGAAEVVFGSDGVHVSAGVEDEVLADLRAPMAFLIPGSCQPDDTQHLRDVAEVEVHLLAEVHGDRVGEATILGGTRSSDGQGSSEGRGLLELEEILHDTVALLNSTSGITLRVAWVSGVAPIRRESGYMASRAYRVEALVTTSRAYPTAKDLAAEDDGDSDNVSLTWDNPASRYDLLEVILRRASGSTAPASVAAGTGVTLGSALAESVTDSTGSAGTYSYSLFVGYDELGAGSSDRYSAAKTVTVVVA